MPSAFWAATSIILSATMAAAAPKARWGTQAVYVPSAQAVYYVGGELSSTGTQITNEVLVLPLNTTDPTFQSGPSTSLPPTAFASLAYSNTTNQLVLAGGLTSSCSDNQQIYYLDLSETEWSGASPEGLVRKRGASAIAGDDGKLTLFGGMIDEYVCSSSTYAYPAYDVFSLPISSSSPSTTSLPSSLTGPSSRAIVDFGLAALSNGTIIIGGGADSSGKLIDLQYLGVYEPKTGDWGMIETTGDIPTARAGHALVAHPNLDLIILHGGATGNASTSATPLLAVLNLTTLAWSTPSNVQPAASAARAWDATVITPSGVLVSAFGIDSAATARNNVVYLDARESETSKWAWKSTWSQDMMNAVSSASTSSSSTLASASTDAADSDSSSNTSHKKLLESVLIPILLLAVLASPLIIYVARRHARNVRRRRMAEHFELDHDHESTNSWFVSNPLDRFRKRRSNVPTPHGGRPLTHVSDSDHDECRQVGIVASVLGRLNRTRSVQGSPQTFDRGDMTQTANTAALTAGQLSRNQWEDIDFGMGKVDAAKRGSINSTSSGGAEVVVSEGLAEMLTPNGPVFDFHDHVDENENPFADPVIGEESAVALDYPVLQPVEAASPRMSSKNRLSDAQKDEWSRLAQDLQEHDPFKGPLSRSASLTVPSTVADPHITPVTVKRSSSITPVLPPLDFDESNRLELNKETQLRPMSSQPLRLVSQSQSQPMVPIAETQDLLSSPTFGSRVATAPTAPFGSPVAKRLSFRIPGSAPKFITSVSSNDKLTPAPELVRTPSQRASVQPTASARAVSYGSASISNTHRNSVGSIEVRRASSASRGPLRVVNMTPKDEEGEWNDAASGRAM